MSNEAGAARRIAKVWGASAMTWTARSAFAMVAICSTAAYAQLAVSDSGTPTYSQAIAVPPGVAGMSPKIGLFYAGGGVNGPVGYGRSCRSSSGPAHRPP